MKKTKRPLTLARETLRRLETPQLHAIAGGKLVYTDEASENDCNSMLCTANPGCLTPVL